MMDRRGAVRQNSDMRTLILLRHSKAVKAAEAPSDEARGLTVRGRRDAEAAGAALADHGLAPALALVSTATRTRETAEIALQGLSTEIRFDRALYHAGPQSLWDAFAESESESVIVIGHNPGMAELVSLLIAQAHDGSRAARDLAGHVPTAAFAAFEIRGDLMRAAGPRLLAAWMPPRSDD
jgi:phosphohistidine phosphatase